MLTGRSGVNTKWIVFDAGSGRPSASVTTTADSLTWRHHPDSPGRTSRPRSVISSSYRARPSSSGIGHGSPEAPS